LRADPTHCAKNLRDAALAGANGQEFAWHAVRLRAGR
jgi:hypothetical protein